MPNKNIVIIGASGGLGAAFVKHYSTKPSGTLYAFSRSPIANQISGVRYGHLDFADETTIVQAAKQCTSDGPLNTVIVATGLLHDKNIMPEKSLRDLSYEQLLQSFLVNTVGPSLVAKHFLPLLHKKEQVIFAALSARVGSIKDNRLGGWYGYRATKAALNMMIKTASIEVARRHKQAIVVGLHPGTVDTGLSEPFQQRVPDGKLFTADYSVTQLMSVLDSLSPNDSGKVFAWDGREVPY